MRSNGPSQRKAFDGRPLLEQLGSLDLGVFSLPAVSHQIIKDRREKGKAQILCSKLVTVNF